MPRTFSVADYRNSVYRGNVARIWTRNHDTTIIKDRSFLSLSLSKLILPPLSHLRPVMFLFMVHDSKLPPGSILFRSAVLIVPRYEDALLFMVVTCSDRTRYALSFSFFPRPPLFFLFSRNEMSILCKKLLKRIIIVHPLWIRRNRNTASLTIS